ncbi:uncharacterized protein LOC130993774 [Salvia miltiorrhiza]|uniref:uncharacterized protein LOC130993774 n=1 Tax=Salvia miltiorrhiza TaxID=226208 RepID=UPI0025ACB793|nr:uncharacterized protein LOC130993774 [Salvia miltiorrhiza]
MDRTYPNPLDWCEEGTNKHPKLIGNHRLFQFLPGLDGRYDKLCRDILKKVPVPSVESAFSKVRREAARLQNLQPATNRSDIDVSSSGGVEAGLAATHRRCLRGQRRRCGFAQDGGEFVQADDTVAVGVGLLHPGISQDWEPVVIRKKAPTSAARKDEKAVNAVRRVGAEIETVKKSNAGTNKAASSSTSLNTRKLDEDSENLTHDKVINEKPQIIKEYQSGKAIPNQQIISKLGGLLHHVAELAIGEGVAHLGHLTGEFGGGDVAVAVGVKVGEEKEKTENGERAVAVAVDRSPESGQIGGGRIKEIGVNGEGPNEGGGTSKNSGIGFGVFTPNPPNFSYLHKIPHVLPSKSPNSEVLQIPPLGYPELQKEPHFMQTTPPGFP